MCRLEATYDIRHFLERLYSLLYNHMQGFKLTNISLYLIELLPKVLIESSRVI